MNLRLLLVVAGLAASFWAFQRWRLAVQLALVVLVLEGAIRKWIFLGAQDLIYFAKDALLLAAFAGFWVERQRRGRSWQPREPLLLGVLALAAFFGVLQIFNPALPNLFVGLLGFKSYFLYIPLLFVVPNLFPTDAALAQFLRRYLLLSVPVGLLGIAQFFSPATSSLNTYARPTGDSVSSAITFGTSTFVRVTATFSFITGYSAYLVTIALLALAWLAVTRWRIRGNLFIYTVLGITLLGMLMTGSRGPVVVLAALFPFYWWLSVAREKQSGATFGRLLVGLVLVGGFLVFVGQDALGAFHGRAAGSGSEMADRILSPVLAPYNALPQAGLLGYGIGSTHQAAPSVAPPGLVPFSWLGAGNIEAETGRIMLELGPIGFVLVYLSRLLLTLAALRQVMRLRTLFHRSLGVACFLSLLAAIPGGLVFDVTSGLLYWFCGGLLFLVVRLDEQAVRAAQRAAAAAAAPPPLEAVPLPARSA